MIRSALIRIMILLALSAIPTTAQVPTVLPPAKPEKSASAPQPQLPQNTPQLTKVDLEAFFDGFLPIQLLRDDVAGAVVVVVKDGQVLFAKGYGYSDVKSRKPVTVDATLFRPGSISKTFTWTAVMQLVEQGKIDLNRDVNDYLDFKIPATFARPVTMKDLMTHTPGFEETLQDLFVGKASDMRALQEYVKAHPPKEIFPPGTTPAYSNYGATLAGYIVQRVSGMPFDDYVEQNILHPLGMQHSTFRQPLPDNLRPLMSNGYNKASQPPKDFEFVQAWPAGSMSVTADDMSHYMMAHLQNGEYNGARILKPETAVLMHSRAFVLAPGMNAIAYGFYEESRNGRRIIGHAGDTQWFHSDMHLMLDDHLGFFISYNSAGKPGFSGRTALWQQFLDRYFPYTPSAEKPLDSAAQDAKAFSGSYWFSRRSETNIAAVTSALNQPRVTVNADGTISLDALKDFAGNPKHFEEIAPSLFREVHGQSRLLFKKDYAGRPSIVMDWPVFTFQAVPSLKDGIAALVIIIFALSMFVLTLLFWPVNAALRKHYGWHADFSPQYRSYRKLIWISCFLDLIFIGCFGLWLSRVQENIAVLSSRLNGPLHFMQCIGLLGVVTSLLCVFGFGRSLGERSLWRWAKLWNGLLVLAFLGYAWFVLNWHMLNFNLNY
jgi:CubicO group peptidase (beta-lactamase class C family)